jgi:uncharacterized lipoprotein YajG
MKKLILLAAVFSLGGCQYLVPPTPDLSALAQDPATITVHTVITSPWATITQDATRVNSTGTAATANSNGTAVNVPQGATVNPAPAKTAPGVVLTPGQPTAPPGQ